MSQQIVKAADPRPSDERLRRGRDAMFGFERVGRFACLQVAVIDGVTLSFEQILRFDAIGTDMLVHHHAVKDSSLVGGHRLTFSNRSMSSLNLARCSPTSPEAMASETQQAA